jgi:hydrophobic/amphiphilic exporter-1 (mainly G- bacteria), HAE1 family
MSLDRAVGWTLSRRVTVFVLAVMVVVVGAIATRRLALELLPKGFQANDVSIVIPVNAANPIEVQETVVRPTEELLRTVPGIKRLVSSAGANEAWLHVEFSKDVDLDLATAEVRDRLERARLSWPPEVRRYRIFRFNFDTDMPVFQFGIVIQQPSDELTFLIEEKIVKPLEAIPGVARVQCRGLLDDQVRIFVDRDRALAAGVNLYELTRALESGNVDVSGGEVEEGGVRYSLKSAGRFQSIEDVENFPVRPGLKLGQIATVEPTKTVRDFIVLSRTSPTLWCRVQKESSANTVETCARVREALQERITPDARLKELGVSFFFFEWGDIGAVITGALSTLAGTAVEGAWLSVFVLLFFLRRLRLTVMIALAIPLSLLITGICVAATGGTLSLLAMIGVTVAIGMLVDDAIVVVEAIQQKREQGYPPLEAARRGTSEIALAVVLSTLTTVVVFIPIMFMSGDTEMTFFLTGIGLPLCFAVLASLVVALLFIPLGTVVCYGWAKTVKPESPLIARFRHSHVIDWMVRSYAKSVAVVLRHRFVGLLAILIPIAGLTAWAQKLLPQTNIMGDDGGRIEVDVDLDANFTLRDAHATFLELGAALEKMGPSIGLKHFWCFFERTGGELLVLLDHEDMEKTKDAAKKIKAELPRPPGVKVQCALQSDRQQQDLRFHVYGDDVVRLADVANDVAEVIESVPGVLRVKNDLRTAEGEVHIVPDREKLQRFGIVPEALWGTVQYGVRGFPLNEIASGEREIPLIIQYQGGENQTLGELRETPLFTRRGAQVPMSAVADVGVRRGFGEIRREGGRARARLTVDTAEKDTEELRKAIKKRLAAHLLPVGFSYEDNRGAEMETAKKQMALAGLLAATFVFLLMGIMFESLMLPLAVFVAVPVSWAGAVMGLGFLGSTLDFVGMIAFILLIGIVVKNGIVLVDCAARLRETGLGQHEALVQAGRLRLRPIVMTALTTVLGLVPMALATATGSQVSYRSLAIATIGGLTLATFVTLYVTPIAYSLFDDLRSSFMANARALVAKRRPAGPTAQPPQ